MNHTPYRSNGPDSEFQAVDLEAGTQTNALCPHRSRCLEEASNKYLPFLDCRDCPHLNDSEEREALFFDLEGCLKLLWSLYGDAKSPGFNCQKNAIMLFDRREWQTSPGLQASSLSSVVQ